MTNLLSKSAIILFVGLILSCNEVIAQDDFFEADPYAKIRLGFTAPTGFYRQILIGFQGGVATEGIDPGYDAINSFDLPCDMYFYCNNTELFIQGVGAFSEMNSYPIGVKLDVTGEINIALEDVEHLGSGQAIYIYDDHTGIYHNLKGGNFVTELDAGVYNHRFALRFFEQTTLSVSDNFATSTTISYSSAERSIYVESTAGLSDTKIQIYSITGQLLKQLNETKVNKSSLRIPLDIMTEGIYIVRLSNINGSFTKKIAVR
jgi:hypothetical protein